MLCIDQFIFSIDLARRLTDALYIVIYSHSTRLNIYCEFNSSTKSAMKICKKTILELTQLITAVLLGLCDTGCWALEMYPKSNLSILNLESCGGLIPIQGLVPGGSLVLNYHSKNTSSHGENCLWTLDTANKKGDRYSIKAKVTLLVSGTVDSHSGLSVVDWKETGTEENRDWILSHQELTPSAPIYESKTWDYNVYLSHSSRKGSSTGFLLFVSLLRTDGQSEGHNFGSTNQCGNKSYGVAEQHDKFSMSISPPKPGTTLTVNTLTSKKEVSSCSGIDSLDIYEIRVKNCPNRLVRLCGTIPSPISYTSQYPLLLTFYTSRRDEVKTNFMISWK